MSGRIKVSIFIFTLLCAFLSLGSGKKEEMTADAVTESIDLDSAFQNMNGCAVIYIPKENRYLFYNEEMCRQEVSPYSTFKVISALSGLENGVLTDETSRMNYNGTMYANTGWNDDLTLKEAFQKSCIWYFKQVVDTVGKDKIKEELDSLSYGNCDVSEWNGSNINPSADLNGFWLESSLKISPLEQVNVFETIFEGKSKYRIANIEIVKELMLAEENGDEKIYGKTGSGNGKAWFVGFSETIEERTYFAVYLNDNTQKDNISGNKAKEIALTIRQEI